MDLKNKKITVMGLGIHGGGEGLARYLSEKGANITVTDLKNEKQLKQTLKNLQDLKNIKYRLGEHKWEDFKNADMVFLNPAVPKNSLWVKRMMKEKVNMTSEMNLFLSECKGKIIGVTGTNGKSTTVNLIFNILKNKFQPVSSMGNYIDIKNDNRKIFFGGNIGGSLLKYLDSITENDLTLLELSSFQLYDAGTIKKSPHISIILNITPDHLDQHTDFKEYVESKKNIIKYQTRSDFAILNYDSNLVKKIASGIESKILYFSPNHKLQAGSYIEDKNIIINFRGKKTMIMPVSDINIPGEHNIYNILAAVLVGNLYGIKPEFIKSAISNFSSLSHRIEFIREIKGVKYYNDSKSTTPESTIAAINCFDKPIILIAGGKEKGFDYSEFAKMITQKIKYVLLIGENANKIEKNISKLSDSNSKLQKTINVKILKNAVRESNKLSKKGDIILFSPGTSSFDQFASYEDRGDKFKKMVEEL
jgi:UDP-N-acetylmuramoylalanine--D-glutamate ligase